MAFDKYDYAVFVMNFAEEIEDIAKRYKKYNLRLTESGLIDYIGGRTISRIVKSSLNYLQKRGKIRITKAKSIVLLPNNKKEKHNVSRKTVRGRCGTAKVVR